MSKFGNALLKVGAYTFSCRSRTGLKTRWRCPHNDLIPIFVESNKGNRLLMLDGHRYRQKRDSRIVGKDRVRWVCSRSERFKCTAKLVTTGQDRIVWHDTAHNHPLKTERKKRKKKQMSIDII
ncbi:FLYWCH zinc finger domain-containing protein [Phthorimaea operculella]|nr:FLYWCH zinc finger domain-containing protein [Phthorimaea operculella]